MLSYQLSSQTLGLGIHCDVDGGLSTERTGDSNAKLVNLTYFIFLIPALCSVHPAQVVLVATVRTTENSVSDNVHLALASL